MRLTFLLLLFSISGYGQIFSLEVVGANGGSGTIPGYSLEWTVGEVAIETYANATNYLTEGFQQIFDEPGDIHQINQITINSYPNPTLGDLYVEIPETNEEMKIQIIDALGQVQLIENYSGYAPLVIDLSTLSAGTYLLNIVSDNGHFKTTTIIKQ